MTLPQAVGSRAVRRGYLTLYRECVSTLPYGHYLHHLVAEVVDHLHGDAS